MPYFQVNKDFEFPMVVKRVKQFFVYTTCNTLLIIITAFEYDVKLSLKYVEEHFRNNTISDKHFSGKFTIKTYLLLIILFVHLDKNMQI